MTNEINPEIARLKKLLTNYCDEVGINPDQKTWSNTETHQLFHLIISDYIEGRVSVDDLATLCELSYLKLPPETSLFSTLLSGAEIEWDIRHNPFSAADTIEELVLVFGQDHSSS